MANSLRLVSRLAPLKNLYTLYSYRAQFTMLVPEKQSFYISYSTLFLWMFAVLMLSDMVLMTVFSLFHLAELQPLVHAKLFAVLSLINSLFIVWAYKCEINHMGVHGTNFWGKPIFISWSSIAKARNRHFFGLNFYVIDSADQVRMHIPRFLGRQREFDLLVNGIIGEQNPLHSCLSKHEVLSPDED